MGAIKCRNNTANNKGMAREYRNREGRRTKAKKGNSKTILTQGLRKKVSKKCKLGES